MARVAAAKTAQIREIGRLIMRLQDATQAYDEQVGRAYGLNLAERHCLSLLVGEGPQTATAIARHVHLTPAAVTALLDRLESRGYVKRRADPQDRRKLIIEAADAALKLASEAYAPVGKAGEELLERFTKDELEVVQRFLTKALEVQAAFLDDAAAAGKKKPTPA